MLEVLRCKSERDVFLSIGLARLLWTFEPHSFELHTLLSCANHTNNAINCTTLQIKQNTTVAFVSTHLFEACLYALVNKHPS